MNHEPPALETRRLSVAFDQVLALADVTVSVPAGSLTAVIGPNGAGKSTLLKAVVGLVPVLAGEVRIFGRPVREARSRLAYVPQREEVDWEFPISVQEVAAMGAYARTPWWRRIGPRDRAVVREALERMGLTELRDRRIGELSGGQQQRAFLARALVQNADLLLLDEPFAGIDATTELAIAELFRELQSAGKTVVCVHHDLDTVPAYFDRVIVLSRELVAAGPVSSALVPEILRRAYGTHSIASSALL